VIRDVTNIKMNIPHSDDVESDPLFVDFLSQHIVSCWYYMGLLLDINVDELCCIDTNFDKIEQKSAEMLAKYKETAGLMSWQHIREQLKYIKKRKLIAKIETKFEALKSIPEREKSEPNIYGKFLITISANTGSYWRRLGLLLGVEGCHLDNIKIDYKTSQEQAMAMILMFEENQKQGVSWQKLKQSLNSMGKSRFIIDLEDKFEAFLRKDVKESCHVNEDHFSKDTTSGMCLS